MKGILRRCAYGASLGLAGLLGAAAWLESGPARAVDCGNPCFEDIDDILAGDHQMLAVDDLVAHATRPENSSNTEIDDYTILTKELNMPPATLTSTVCQGAQLPFFGASPTSAAIGRPYATINDVLIQTVLAFNQNQCSEVVLKVTDHLDSANNFSTPIQFSTDFMPPVLMTLADFDFDSYDDVLLIGYDRITGKTTLQIYTAQCTGDLGVDCSTTQGPADGLVLAQGSTLGLPGFLGLVVPQTGDFNGDGIVDLVWAVSSALANRTANTGLRFASVCPAPDVVLFQTDPNDPSTGITCTSAMQIVVPPGQAPLPLPIAGAAIDMAVGNFDGAVNSTTGRTADELLLVASTVSDKTSRVYFYEEFDGFFGTDVPTAPISTADKLQPGNDNGKLDLQSYIAAGRLKWSGQQDQAVWATTFDSSCCDRRGEVHVLHLDNYTDPANPVWVRNSQSLPEFGGSGGDVKQKTRIIGVAIGRFDPLPDSDGNTDFDQQFAVLVDQEQKGLHDASANIIFTYDVDTSDFTPSKDPLGARFITGAGVALYYQNDYFQFNTLLTGDLQGRSQTLGAAEKLVLLQIQPDIILGVPPMHVDYAPDISSSDPIVNVSVFPGHEASTFGFNTDFAFESSASQDSQRTSTTSYTVATKTSGTEKVGYGIAKGNVSAELKESVATNHTHSVQHYSDNYTAQTNTFEDGTSFEDKVSYTVQYMNIYSYPVIGQFSCPLDSSAADNIPADFCCPTDLISGTNCTTTDEEDLTPIEQVYVQYSGPDHVDAKSLTDSASLEWYQPLTEPGNLFSFAPNKNQIIDLGPKDPGDPPADGEPAADLLFVLGSSKGWSPQQNSNPQEMISWEASGTTATTTDTSDTTSIDGSVSFSEKKNFGVANAKFTQSFSIDRTKSHNTLNTSTTTTDASTGFTLNRGIGTNTNNENFDIIYKYSGQSFIFSLNPPSGQLQDLDLEGPVTSNGYVQVSHTVDMISNSGSFWTSHYGGQLFDLAVNHPVRWFVDSTRTEGVQFNCPFGYTESSVPKVGGGSVQNGTCVASNADEDKPTPTNLAEHHAPFYLMKGFFVRSEGASSGPAISQATQGDIVTLQARIHNFSLVAIPGAESANPATVKVQFYAQPTDSGGNFLDWNDGDPAHRARFIGEVDWKGGIGAFCGYPLTTCDQGIDTPLNWIALSVDWDTGQVNNPTSDSYWKFWVVAWVEDASGNLIPELDGHGLSAIPDGSAKSFADIAIAPVNGLPDNSYSNNLGYYNQNFFLEKSVATATAETGGAAKKGSLAISGLDLPDEVLVRNKAAVFRVGHNAGGKDLQFVLVSMMEEEPGRQRRVIDTDILPLIRRDTDFETVYRYRPTTCGDRTLTFEASSRDAASIVRQSVNLDVRVDPAAEARSLMNMIRTLALPRGIQSSLMAKLRAAEKSFERGQERVGLNKLNAFANEVGAQMGKKIPMEDVDRLLFHVGDIEDCLQ